jgi:hypothetical protein
MSFYLLFMFSQKYYTALELLSRVVFLTAKYEVQRLNCSLSVSQTNM